MTPDEAKAELERDYPSFQNQIEYVAISERIARSEAEARVKELEEKLADKYGSMKQTDSNVPTVTYMIDTTSNRPFKEK